MALKTDYKAFIAPETGRRFHQTPNSDGTVTMTDVTVYTQEGDYYGPEALNTTNAKVNEIEAILGVGAGAHNSIYGGRFLGNAVTGEQYAAIADGSFTDMYIGDYWVISDTTYRIAAFDYYLRVGNNTDLTTHHITLVPDVNMYTGGMNSTDVTTGGYYGSEMYTTGLTQAKTTINEAFGAAHVLNHRQYLCNEVTNGRPSGGSWYDSTVELMNEHNVYGGKIFAPTSDGTTLPQLHTVDKSQYPLFTFRPDMISNRQTFWLRDVVSAINFANVYTNGNASNGTASSAYGVRPAFSIVS